MKKIKLLYIILLLLITIAPTYAQRWAKVTSIPSAFSGTYWLDIYFLPSNPSYGWICGFQGSVLRTTDGGTTWSGTRVTGANHLESVHFPSVNIGYVSGLEGIFKSTNGGASWAEITPSSSTYDNFWGCYFLDDNNGFVIGGGCSSSQNFWRTTDGGSNWTPYIGNFPNSGLTDLIVYSMGGAGYASSSGWIWQTNDGGLTWAPWSNTGNHDWQEEITRVGNSFLVPTSNGCSGGSGGGGMRFTTDNGVNWNRFNTGTSMFGAFLLNTLTGWVAGDSKNVWHTSNGGINWQLRNCGFESGNLDDIWFTSPTNGWIVGEGVYRLAEPLQTTDKNRLDFSELCIPSAQELELYVQNINFNSDNVTLAILNDPLNEFSIVKPGSGFTIKSCENEAVTVRFSPKSTGVKTAVLRVNFDYGTTVLVDLNGMGMTKTAAPQDTLLIINPAYCGTDNAKNMTWKASTTRESVRELVFYEGNNNIRNFSSMPHYIAGGSSQTVFISAPMDTGWISARFSADFMPCVGDTFLTVKAYGVSPIITSKSSASISVQCNPTGMDTIPVRNTGNTDLLISDIFIVEPNTNLTFKGWVGNYTAPLLIKPDSVRYAIIQFSYNATKPNKATLRILNNDLTTIRGIKNSYDIPLSGRFGASNLWAKDSVVNFGKVCVGAEESFTFFFVNTDSLSLVMEDPVNDSSQFTVIFDAIKYPIELNFRDSVRCTIKFKPNYVGFISDTIYFAAQPCDQLLKFYVNGTGVNSSIKANPDNLSLTLQTKRMQSNTVNIRSLGTEDVRITNIELSPPASNIILNFNPPLNQLLTSNANIDFNIEITALVDTVYNGYLCFTGKGFCDCGTCIQVSIKSFSSNVAFDRDSLDFGFTKCNSAILTDSVIIFNSGFIPDSIKTLDIIPSNTAFSIRNKPNLPYQLEADDSLTLYIEYDAKIEGKYSATLSMTTVHSGTFSRTVIMEGEFRKADSKNDIIKIDFGSIESCDEQLELKINFHNSGTLKDSILITRFDSNTGFIIVPDNFILIDPSGDAELIIYADPGKFPLGSTFDTLYFISEICPNLISVPLQIETYHHLLTYTPDSLIYQNAWADELMTKNFTIKNNSPYPKDIINMQVLPNDDNYKLMKTYNYPIRFNPGDSLVMPVSFFTTSSGIYSASVQLFEQMICEDTAYVYLFSEVPPELYETTVSIGDYRAGPGEVVKLALSIDGTMDRLKHSGINYKINFDPMLFYPTALLVKNGASVNTVSDVKYHYGELSGFIDSSFTKNIFKESGDILWIIGTMYVSNPDSTPVVIESFEPVTSKNVLINKKDGSLKLINACMPLAEFGLRIINRPKLYIKENPVDNGEIGLIIETEESTTMELGIFNSEGFRVIEKNEMLNNGYNELKMNMNDFGSGVYYILIKIRGHIYRERIILIN